MTMKRMAVSTFKARCLAILKDVQATGEPVVVTKRGAPLVKVIPAETERGTPFGFMAEEFKIVGDIEAPLVPLKQWKITKK
jgi:prevent-host-death family protein